MKKKIVNWLAKKLKVKTENIILTSVEIKYDFINPDTFEITSGKKTLNI